MRSLQSNRRFSLPLSLLTVGLVALHAGGCFTDEPPAETTGSSGQSGASTDETSTGSSSTSDGAGTETDGAGLCGAPDSYSYQIGDECSCVSGYVWCSENPTDYSCCAEEQLCDLAPPPDACDPALESAYCTSTRLECLAESQYYSCDQDGSWSLDEGTSLCMLSGYDFSYGCVDNADAGLVENLCGTGPGTPCDGEPDSCADDDTLTFCAYERLGAISCIQQCQEVGDNMGVTYDYGSCGEQSGEFRCLCCDLEDPGCGG